MNYRDIGIESEFIPMMSKCMEKEEIIKDRIKYKGESLKAKGERKTIFNYKCAMCN